MNETEFKKGIEEIKKINMSSEEKASMLQRIFSSTPIKSPYMKHSRMFAFVLSNQRQAMFASFFVTVLIGGGVVYASDESLPGDVLYFMKIRAIEPLIGVINVSTEENLAWTEEKVIRRIEEAESLAVKNKLDDKKAEELNFNLEKNSKAFAEAINTAASSTEDSVSAVEEKTEKIKQDFRDKIKTKVKEGKEGTENSQNDDQLDKVERLKGTVIRVLDSKDKFKK